MIDSSNTIVSKNYITASVSLARPAVTVIAQTTNITNITFADNVVDGSDGVLYNFTRLSTYTISGVITGNTARSTGANSQAMSFLGLSNAVVSNNLLAAGFVGLYMTSCTNVRGSSNNCIGSGGLRLLTAGTNSNVYFDSTNDFNTADTANIQNQAVGVAVEQRLNSPPPGGTWQVGDRIVQTVPVVGQPKAWSCTSAGAPGTWTSEGNL